MKKSSLKITAGINKGRKIYFSEEAKIRPATSKVREAIFNILQEKVKDADILDLFAGSGSVGLEALSRSAKSCIFIDYDRKVIENIKENISLCKVENNAKVYLWDIMKNLNCLKDKKNFFDIVFIDPPYYKDYLKQTLINLQNSNSLKENAIIVIEHYKKDELPKDIFNFIETRNYGKTNLSFLGVRQ